MAFAKGRAEDGDDIVTSHLSGGEAVGVALDDDGAARPRHPFPGGVEPVEERAFREHRRLGGIDVLGTVARSREDSAPEGDAPTLRITDGEHHPVAEAVVMAGAFLPLDRETGPHEHVGRESGDGCLAEEPVPGGGGVAELETVDGGLRKTTVAEIVAGALCIGAAAEGVGVAIACPAEHLVKGLPLVDRHGAAHPGDVDAGTFGELMKRVAEFELFHPHQKAEHVPPHAAHPTAISLSLGADLEAGLGVVVPGAEADQRLPLAAEGDEGRDQVGDVSGIADPFLDVVGA